MSGHEETKYLDWDDDKLLTELADVLLPDELGFGPRDLRGKRRYAREWLQRHEDAFRERVCRDPAVRALIERETGDLLAEVALTADALSALLGHPSATIVAVILARRGLQALCDE